MNISEIDKLSRLDVENLCNTEEDVKMKFIVPLLKALGHKEDIYYESDRMDIVIKGGPYKTTMLVEAKHHSKQLRDHIQQLHTYWSRHRSTIAVLSNGREIWIFHPYWMEKPFNDTLLFSIKRQDLVAQKDVLYRLMSAESMQKGETKKYLRDYEDEIDDQENRIVALKEEKAAHIRSISELNDKIRTIDDEIKHIEQTMPLNIHSEISSEPVVVIHHDLPKLQTTGTKMYVAALNAANYYGLIMEKQIMFCINLDRMAKVNNYVLYPMPSDSGHAISIQGHEFLRNKAPTQSLKYACYHADATYIKLTKNILEMWKKLYDEKLFPFWGPEGGPYKFNNNRHTGQSEPKYIALCKIYGLNIPPIAKDDISRTMDTIRQIISTQKCEDIQNALKNKVQIAKALYENHSKRILEIVNEYDAGFIRK